MTEEEKEMAFLEYMRHGYHHPSMTKIIEEKAALTTLELKSTKKVPEKDWHKLFDLSFHLHSRGNWKARCYGLQSFTKNNILKYFLN